MSNTKHEIQKLAQLGEEGKGCEIMSEIQEFPYEERMKLMKQIALQSQIDSLENPNIPSLTFSFGIQGAPAGSFAIASLRTGDWSGIGLGGSPLVTDRNSIYGLSLSWSTDKDREIVCENVEEENK